MSDKNSKLPLKFTSLVNVTQEIPKLEVKETRNNTYLNYGDGNLFPEYLWDLYTHSSQFASIANTMAKYIMGNGLVNNTGMEIVNRKGETFEYLIEKLVMDYIIYGGFALQVIRNKGGEICELNWVDFQNIRTNYDEDKIWYNKYWNRRNKEFLVYERYRINERQPNSILYYKGVLTRNQYPMPIYMSALTAIEISTQIPDYHLNNLTNGFHPSAIINFNNGGNLSDDVMDEIEESLKEKFQGTQNASKILLSFNDDKEHATTIERLSDEGNVDVYNQLAESVKSDIYGAFRINKLLLGNAEDNTGFNKQAYIESFAIYQKTVISPIQKEIKRIIESVFGQGKFDFIPFSVDWTDSDTNEETSDIIQ